jgi:tryptophanyl-tRNA synthetase
MAPAHDSSKRSLSGMRPTGPLHLGHYFGALKNWVAMQETMQTYFFVADWHALTSEYEHTDKIREFVPELVMDWIAAGLDPEKSVLFRQSDVKEHAELTLLLSMITPVGWLERCPTYKEQQENIVGRDLSTYGFLGYPVIMSADILMYRSRWVPVGQDQVPHLELTREIARRFNTVYGDTFPEPEAHLTPAARCPGLDGRKMSKSYNNFIALRESMADIAPKIKGMLTDTARLRRADPGSPDRCNLFPYHALLTDAPVQAEIRAGCVSASLGCVDCKKILLQSLERFLGPLQERRRAVEANPGRIWDILEAGNAKARAEARLTMEIVRDHMGM